MSKILYVSDLHLSHANVIRFENRPYDNADQMDEAMILIWNNKVDYEDEVYIIGDVGWDPQKLRNILPRLNGKKYLVYGNHDKAIRSNNPPLQQHFEWVKDYHELSDNGQHVTLLHYPMLTWNRSHYGSYQLYGHIHSMRGGKADNFPGVYNTQFNVCWDLIEEPCTLDEIIQINKLWWDELGIKVTEKIMTNGETVKL